MTTATELSTDGLRALAEQAGRDLEHAHPVEILAWAARTFGSDLVVASSMGDEILVHMAAEAAPGIDVIFLDTGYHFAETLGTRDYYADFTNVSLRTILPLTTVAQQDAEHGPRLHDRDPNLCCAMRKVEPLERGLAPYTAWVTGMRREDAPTRTDITVVGWDDKRGKVKLNPLAAWTQDDVDAYVEANNVVLNPLRQVGYASIGCEPCTRAVAPGEDARAGRWSGTSKTECGLHT
ncbi:phosphoadenylyl-sulfate reductase [Cellulomonas rhizosphaerae]|uniref:Adenosine 5'-phosphosulfate reductase n=1 Tax=Cellulomonas rhizosphaerae TaxID=2293719 RepID=A0A413RM21_9CELL|nr:phosphoadenylyl-sulfate reductase [Cellulomonas rhizosphaerae]RHA41306.1 phosphoadenylyl-sulfate reductase [Cellulomonas rhizosphaerae]